MHLAGAARLMACSASPETTAGGAMGQLQAIDVGTLRPQLSALKLTAALEEPPMLPSGRHPVAQPAQSSASRQHAELGVADELGEARAALRRTEAEMLALCERQQRELQFVQQGAEKVRLQAAAGLRKLRDNQATAVQRAVREADERAEGERERQRVDFERQIATLQRQLAEARAGGGAEQGDSDGGPTGPTAAGHSESQPPGSEREPGAANGSQTTPFNGSADSLTTRY